MPSVIDLENEINIPVDNTRIFRIDLCTYVFGIADVAGEVMRFTTSSIDMDAIHRSLKFMRQMYDVFISIHEKEWALIMICLRLHMESESYRDRK